MLEADRFGHGPSGRNGGFVNSLWLSLGTMRARYGQRRRWRSPASGDSVDAVGRFCAEQEVDAWYRKAGLLQVSAAPAQDATLAAAARSLRGSGAEVGFTELSEAEVARRCGSPRFRGRRCSTPTPPPCSRRASPSGFAGA